MTTALITWGGWEGHEPDKVAHLFRNLLEKEGMQVEVTDTLDCFDDAARLKSLDLIVPVWTMSTLTRERATHISDAVGAGTGLAGCHGGMCDAFRDNVLWQFMTGGNWVAHPGGDGVTYDVRIVRPDDDLVAGLQNFSITSEQYYLHVDPAVSVLAETTFPTVNWYHAANGPVNMPVAWTKMWGLGRVYYNALGHKADVIDHGEALEMLRRGLIWAAKGKAHAKAKGLDPATYQSEGNHL